ncbi:antibiotic biosynthesis monooxygenase [Priestia megaterium]|uniref:antibiotic biosynthesis monooxygenase family protein n=1 Tax=Priestia megaterium TaxID=1404 RepID=UPI000BF32FF1|nr:antibiotic biosynthesis monooxygenase family protein [Priestia megaterium]PFP14530.1 antibiotic biosynthesis monooxygenase [Priestia megaterium]PFU53163.1 antibiotic biosynthesis monooxygenase [Priestia megaterium]
MIIEHAMLTIKEELVEEFVQTINEAFPILSSSEGHLSHKLLRNKEKPTHFILVVHWNSLHDHLDSFVGSAKFKKWDSLLRRFFDSDPEVLHYTELRYD